MINNRRLPRGVLGQITKFLLSGVLCYLMVIGAFQVIFMLKIGRMDPTVPITEFNGRVDAEVLRILYNPKKACQRQDVQILFCIKSSVMNFGRRQVVRDTWSRFARNSKMYKVMFFVGKPNAWDHITSKFLLYEMNTFHDVVQGNFVDSYKNLTLKSTFLLKWSSNNCPQARYTMSMDDDTFVNVKNLFSYVKSLNGRPDQLAGYLSENARPFRNQYSKWFASYKSYPGEIYPNFLMGAGYIMSSDVVKKLSKCTMNEPLFHLDDVFVTGICAQKNGIVPQYAHGFTLISLVPSACFFDDVITGPDMTEEDMVKVHHEIQANEQFSSVLCFLTNKLYISFLLLAVILVSCLAIFKFRYKLFAFLFRVRGIKI